MAKKSAAALSKSLDGVFAQQAAASSSNMSDTTKRAASTSPVKEKMEALKKMRSEMQSPGAGDPILDAIKELSKKFDKVALKSDLDELKEFMQHDTKTIVEEAVDPIKTELNEVKQEMNAFKVRLQRVESTPPAPVPPSAAVADKTLNELRSAVHALDPAHRRAAFVGWPESMPAPERINQMETFMKTKFPNYHVVEYLNHYTGPYKDRKLGKVSFVEFGNKSTAKNFTNAVDETGAELKVKGQSIKVKSARTKFNSSRNYSMRVAQERIKAHAATGTKTVEFKWEARTVTVDNEVAFSQSKAEIGGTFVAPYSDLSLE